jgi:hypothetical protein
MMAFKERAQLRQVAKASSVIVITLNTAVTEKGYRWRAGRRRRVLRLLRSKTRGRGRRLAAVANIKP